MSEHAELVNDGQTLSKDFPRTISITDSSLLDQILYNPKSRKLRIHFKTGSLWEYDEVWPGDFAALIAAYSIGQTFNERIRDRFEARRIAETIDKEVPAKKAVAHEHS